jgi:hypothetical protein
MGLPDPKSDEQFHRELGQALAAAGIKAEDAHRVAPMLAGEFERLPGSGRIVHVKGGGVEMFARSYADELRAAAAPPASAPGNAPAPGFKALFDNLRAHYQPKG